MAVDIAISEPLGGHASTAHPLDPLSGAEIERAAAIIKASEHATQALRFVMISLEEPPKPATLTFGLLAVPARKAFAVTYDAPRKLIAEAVVNLDAAEVESWTPVPGRFPSYLSDTLTDVEKVVREDPRWQEAMRKRGVTDFDLVMIDPVARGLPLAARMTTATPDVCLPADVHAVARRAEHGYARPVEGLIVTVRPGRPKVIDVEDHGVVPLPPHRGQLHRGVHVRARTTGPRSEAPRRHQADRDHPARRPELRGRRQRGAWQKWQLRVGFTAREGSCCTTITYEDAAARPILHRASISEMVVPYGDPADRNSARSPSTSASSASACSTNSLTLGLRLPRRHPLLRRPRRRRGGQRRSR